MATSSGSRGAVGESSPVSTVVSTSSSSSPVKKARLGLDRYRSDDEKKVTRENEMGHRIGYSPNANAGSLKSTVWDGVNTGKVGVEFMDVDNVDSPPHDVHEDQNRDLSHATHSSDEKENVNETEPMAVEGDEAHPNDEGAEEYDSGPGQLDGKPKRLAFTPISVVEGKMDVEVAAGCAVQAFNDFLENHDTTPLEFILVVPEGRKDIAEVFEK
ncbi:hypothetical protein HK102_009191, partial [Quaeritorhiza haematococci]